MKSLNILPKPFRGLMPLAKPGMILPFVWAAVFGLSRSAMAYGSGAAGIFLGIVLIPASLAFLRRVELEAGT